MKKVIYMAMALLTTVLVASCSKEDVGGTATESMAASQELLLAIAWKTSVYYAAMHIHTMQKCM